MNSLSDEHLVKSCLDKNRAHCRLLYERYKNYVAWLIRRHCKDLEVVRDLTQETFTKTFKGLKKFRGESAFKSWVSRITINLCYDHLRELERKQKRSHISLDDTENGSAKELPAPEKVSNPQGRLLQQELRAVVDRSVDKLTAEHKTAILLWVEGFSYAEISEITRVSEKTVGSRIFYAKKELRGRLKPYVKGNDR